MVGKATMQYIYDENGKKYLDCISNVQHGKSIAPKWLARRHPIQLATVIRK